MLSFRDTAAVAALAAVYFLASKLGLMMAFVHASASAVWPPTGIAFAAFLLLGYRFWPGVFLGAFAANLLTEGSFATSVGIAAGNTLEGLIGVYLVNRYAGGRRVFDRYQDIFKFVLLAGTLSTAVSATIGVTTLAAGGFADWARYGSIWFTWWLGDMAGNFIVAPFVVLWWLDPRWKRPPRETAEFLLLLAALVTVGVLAFGGTSLPLQFLCLPPLLWAAFRFGQRETATAVFILASMAVWSTLQGSGPFAVGPPNQSLLLLQSFMAVISVTKLVVAAGLRQRRLAISTLESSFRQSEEWARQIIETANDAFIEMDDRGFITDWNREAVRIFGWTRSEAIGQSLADAIIPPPMREAHRKGFARFMNTGVAPIFNKRIQLSALHRSGREFPIELVVWPLQRDGTFSFNAFIHDITERKEAEEALMKAHDELEERVETRTRELTDANAKLQKLDEMKSNFIMSASHELRTPLTAINGYISLILGEKAGKVSGAQREFLDHVKMATDRLHRLVNQLLTMSRIESGQAAMEMEAVDVLKLLNEQISLYKAEAGQKQIALDFHVENDLKIVMCDSDKIQQVIDNLITNALKYTPQNGQISVRAERRDKDIEIRVKDTGIGISPEDQLKIFEPFYHLHKKGLKGEESTGLGLALAKAIMEAHGGRLLVESRFGQGSTFIAILPLSK